MELTFLLSVFLRWANVEKKLTRKNYIFFKHSCKMELFSISIILIIPLCFLYNAYVNPPKAHKAVAKRLTDMS